MSAYAAPVRDMAFALDELAGLRHLATLPGYEDATEDLVGAVLTEAGRFAGDVFAATNSAGDRSPAVLENGVVRTSPGFREAYRQYVEAGWNAMPFAPEHGGQGLPWSVTMAVLEMLNSANMALSLCPILNFGAVEAIAAHATPADRALYLPRLVSGEWTGTMNLTEPQAGSDVGAVRTRALPQADGSYRIHGQKIYITYGEHDLTENIVHLVLARLPDAPEGTRGISLFLVPKFIPDAEGRPGRRNDLRCVSLEHKLGIHGSPTCVMSFGDDEGAVGWLVGEENRGMACMFTMMNNARLVVGLQGVALAERAYQQARDYALARVQSRALDRPQDGPVAIIAHPDVRRMLLTMRALTEGGRALAYYTMGALDRAKREPDGEARAAAQAMVDLLTPVVKAWSTDRGVEVASLGIQVHGGMGFIEETGAAQHYRDVRITPIYEGTNGIQANDLVFRKLLRDGGQAMRALIGEIAATVEAVASVGNASIVKARLGLADGLAALEETTDWLLRHGDDGLAAAAGAAPYLRLVGTVVGGWGLTRQAIAAARAIEAGHGDVFHTSKLATARFYAEHVMPGARADAAAATAGAETTMSLPAEAF